MYLAEWSGINALLYYGPTLMHSLGLQGDAVTLMTAGGIGIVQFLAVLPAIDESKDCFVRINESTFIDSVKCIWKQGHIKFDRGRLRIRIV